MKPVPLAVGSTQPVTVTSFPSFTVTFDFDSVWADCAPRPTEQAVAKQNAIPMSFMLRSSAATRCHVRAVYGATSSDAVGGSVRLQPDREGPPEGERYVRWPPYFQMPS